MTPDEFRRHAHALVDWMADYLRDVGQYPVAPDVVPGQIRAALPPAAPEAGEPFERIADDFRRIVVPGMTHWNHPSWFGYFAANQSPPSILAEMLTATLGAQCMSWITSPAATELEQVVMGWLRELLALPATFNGVIQDTASTATLVALLSARERATGFRAGTAGLAGGPTLTVYASTEAHSSVDKAVKLAGYGLDHLRRVDVDGELAMDPAALQRAIEEDRVAGRVPACVVATIGTTSSTAVDPLRAIAEICRREGIWLHVDAAWAGTAAIVPECRPLFDGIEDADSFVFNPHKWMLVNFDCTAYFVRDVETLLRTCRTTPEYLRTAYDPEVVNFRDWGIQLGRRFRALKLWFVLRSYGAEALRAMVRRHIALGRELAEWVRADPDFELLAPAPLGLVCLRYRPRGHADDEAALDRRNLALLQQVNATGRAFLTHTRLRGRIALRVAIGQRTTGPAEVAALWAMLRQEAHRLDGGA